MAYKTDHFKNNVPVYDYFSCSHRFAKGKIFMFDNVHVNIHM